MHRKETPIRSGKIFCRLVGIPGVITYANCFDDRLRGLEVERDEILPFLSDFKIHTIVRIFDYWHPFSSKKLDGLRFCRHSTSSQDQLLSFLLRERERTLFATQTETN